MDGNSAEADIGNGALTLLCDPQGDDGAGAVYRRVIQRLDEAEETIEIHMFVWRNDAISNEIGEAVLRAAERGVKIRIRKDRGAIMYERIEMNRRSFFDSKLTMGARLKLAAIRPTFPDTRVRDDRNASLGEAIRNHPNVTFHWGDHTHTKYYIFDERVMILGSVNIEDRHLEYHDYMVEIACRETIRRFRRRDRGEASFDSGRDLDFLLNHRAETPPRFEIKKQILRSIAEAQHAIYVEMAYIGDPEVSLRLIGATRHGVRVKILFSRAANVGNDINYRVLKKLYEAADIEVCLSDRMLHSKLMLFDWKVAILGSANLSVFSMEKADELDIIVRDRPEFMKALNAEVRRRLDASERIESVKPLRNYSSFLASLQQLHQKLS